MRASFGALSLEEPQAIKLLKVVGSFRGTVTVLPSVTHFYSESRLFHEMLISVVRLPSLHITLALISVFVCLRLHCDALSASTFCDRGFELRYLLSWTEDYFSELLSLGFILVPYYPAIKGSRHQGFFFGPKSGKLCDGPFCFVCCFFHTAVDVFHHKCSGNAQIKPGRLISCASPSLPSSRQLPGGSAMIAYCTGPSKVRGQDPTFVSFGGVFRGFQAVPQKL
jgi:hypothetical protein